MVKHGYQMLWGSMPVELEKQFYIFDYQNYSQKFEEMRIQGKYNEYLKKLGKYDLNDTR